MENRPFPPSERRLAEARRDGNIPVSSELAGAAAFAVGAALVASLALGWAAIVKDGLARAFGGGSLSLAPSLRAYALAFAPIGVATFAATILVGIAQRRSFTRSRGPRAPAWFAAVRLAVALALVASLGSLGTLAARFAVALVALGLAEVLLVRRRWWRDLHMTRREHDREQREETGDPTVRAERRRRLLATHAAAADADLVVFAPDVAVALAWDRRGAPRVVARGERVVARRLVEVARRAGRPLVADAALAGALSRVPPGSEIPESLFDPVAALYRQPR